MSQLSILDTLLGSEIFTDHLEGFISKCYTSISGGDDFSFCLSFLFWDDAAIRTIKGRVQPEYIFFLLLELLFIPLYSSGAGCQVMDSSSVEMSAFSQIHGTQ